MNSRTPPIHISNKPLTQIKTQSNNKVLINNIKKIIDFNQTQQLLPHTKANINKLRQYGICSVRLPDKKKLGHHKQYNSTLSNPSSFQISKQIYNSTMESVKQISRNKKKKISNNNLVEKNKKAKHEQKRISLKEAKDSLQLRNISKKNGYNKKLVESFFTVFNSDLQKDSTSLDSLPHLSEKLITEEDELILLVKQYTSKQLFSSRKINNPEERYIPLEFYVIKIQRFWRSYRTKKLINSYLSLFNKLKYATPQKISHNSVSISSQFRPDISNKNSKTSSNDFKQYLQIQDLNRLQKRQKQQKIHLNQRVDNKQWEKKIQMKDLKQYHGQKKNQKEAIKLIKVQDEDESEIEKLTNLAKQQILSGEQKQINKSSNNQSQKLYQEKLKFYINQVEFEDILYFDEGSKQPSSRSVNSNYSYNDHQDGIDQRPKFIKNLHKNPHIIKVQQNYDLEKVDNQFTKLRFDQIEILIQKRTLVIQHLFEQQTQFLRDQFKLNIITKEQFEREYKNLTKWLDIKTGQLEKYYQEVNQISKQTKQMLKQLNMYDFQGKIGLIKSLSDTSMIKLTRKQSNQQQLMFKLNLKSLEAEENDKHEKQQNFEIKLNQIQQEIDLGQSKIINNTLGAKFLNNQKYKEQISDQQQTSHFKEVSQHILNILLNDFISDIKNSDNIQYGVLKLYNKQVLKKPKGIRTDKVIIDSFIKKIIEYVFNKNELIFEKLKQPLGPNSFQMLKYIRSDYQKSVDEKEQNIIPFALFEEFEKLILDMMVFEKQFQNTIFENQRIQFIKSLINFHNQAIFDALNQNFDFERRYGIWGEPYFWKLNNQFTQNINVFDVDQAVQNTRIRVLKCQQYCCGLHPEKIFKFQNNNKLNGYLENLREDRLSKMLAETLIQEEQSWLKYDIQQTFIKLDLTSDVAYQLLQEAIFEIQFIMKKRMG